MAATQIHGIRQIKAGTIDDTLVDASIIIADGSNAFAADQSMGGNQLTNVGTPAADSDAATKAYVDQARAGLLVKDPVRVATTANITLSGTQTIDGVALSVGNRVLVKNQTAPAENGVYDVAAGAWARSTDADVDADVKAGLAAWVNEGTANADKRFVLTTDDPIVVGTTALTFTQDSAVITYSGGAGIVLTGSTFDIIALDTSLTINADDISVRLATNGGLEVSTGVKVKLDGATLALGAGGTKVADAGITETQLATSVAGNGLTGGAGTALAVNVAAAGGIEIATDALQAKLDGSSLLVGAGGLKVNPAKFLTRETPTGAVNGSNTTYTLANTPIVGSESVFVNGLLMESGAGNDYTISGAVITSLVVLQTGDKIRVNYMIA